MLEYIDLENVENASSFNIAKAMSMLSKGGYAHMFSIKEHNELMNKLAGELTKRIGIRGGRPIDWETPNGFTLGYNLHRQDSKVLHEVVTYISQPLTVVKYEERAAKIAENIVKLNK